MILDAGAPHPVQSRAAPVAGTHAHQRITERLALLVQPQPGFWRQDWFGFVLDLALHRFPDAGLHQIAAVHRHRFIADDPIEPRFDLRVTPEGVQALTEPHRNGLDDVRHVIRPRRVLARDRRDVLGMALEHDGDVAALSF